MRGYWNNALEELRSVARNQAFDPGDGPWYDDVDDSPKDRKYQDNSEEARMRRQNRIPPLVKPGSCPPLISFESLPEHFIWLDWIRSGRFGENRIPSGSFDNPDSLVRAGWVNVGYPTEGITAKVSVVPAEGRPENRILKMSVEVTNRKEVDQLPAALDFPPVAVRSPAIQVGARNLIRISVLVKRPMSTAPGAGGVIIRDSIGGEQFQFRASEAIPDETRVILYRRAPADMAFSVSLGLAGYGEVYFDDLRVELVEEADIPPNGALVQDGPTSPSPGTDAGNQPNAEAPVPPATAERPISPAASRVER
jgi:hypothetical protein